MKNVNISATILLLVVFSCGTKEQTKQNRSDFYDVTESQEFDKSVRETVDDIFDNMISPSEIPHMVRSTNVGFDPTLINSLHNTDEYLKTSQKSELNLGVYNTDISYLVSYEMIADAMVYMEHAKTLADYLEISTAYDVSLMRKIEDNIENPDTIATIIDNEAANTTKYLRGDYRTKSAVVILIGGVIEGLYVSTELISRSSRDSDDTGLQEIASLVVNQTESVEDIIFLFENLEEHEENAELIKDLEELQSLLLLVQTPVSNFKTDQNWLNAAARIRELRGEVTSEFYLL